MNQFVQRIANYIANEVIVKGLAESRTFQRFALRTHTSVQEFKQQGKEQMNGTIDEISKKVSEQATESVSSKAAAGPPQPPLRGVSGFLSAFGKELRKDTGFGN